MTKKKTSFLISGPSKTVNEGHARYFLTYFGQDQILKRATSLAEASTLIDSLCSDCSCVCMFLDCRHEKDFDGNAILKFFKEMSASLGMQEITFKLILFADPGSLSESEETHFIPMTQLAVSDYWPTIKDALSLDGGV